MPVVWVMPVEARGLRGKSVAAVTYGSENRLLSKRPLALG